MRISREELESLFIGYGYTPYFVEGSEPEAMHQLMAKTLDTVIAEIHSIQHEARTEGRTTLALPAGKKTPTPLRPKEARLVWRSRRGPCLRYSRSSAPTRVSNCSSSRIKPRFASS